MALTKIQAAGLTADLIDETKLADNSIDSEHYNDGSIDNAHLADDAVGIAELSATGTASSSTFLRGDNSWQAISTTTEGTAVLSTGETGTAKFLRVDGDDSCSWQVPPDTTYSVGDGGLTQNNFTNTLKTKLDGIAASANAYVHPNHSGEVTSTADGATVIADDIVDEANLKVDNSPTNDYVLTAKSSAAGGLTWAAASASPDWQSFQAEMVGDQTITNHTWTRIKFNAQNWDTNSNYDHTDNDWYYEAPATGKYWYKVSLLCKDLAENGTLRVALYKDSGSGYVEQKKTLRINYQPNAANKDQTVETTGLIELTSGHKVAVYGYHNHNATRDFDDNFCLFEMFKLDGV